MNSLVAIRPWQDGDLDLLLAAESLFSAHTLSQRFLVGSNGFPAHYVHMLRDPDGDGRCWLGQVAVAGRRIVGLAECAWLTGRPESADLAVLVADAWQRHGIGRLLLTGLLQRSREQHLGLVHAVTARSNQATRMLAGSYRRVEPESAGPAGTGLAGYAVRL